MKRKLPFLGLLVGTFLLGGVFFASNMGFKTVYRFLTPVHIGSQSGLNPLALPYIRKPGLVKASDLWADLWSQGIRLLQNIQRFDRLTDQNQVYFGGEPDFNLVPGEGYLIKVGAVSGEFVDYQIVGSHDPAFQVVFKKSAPGISASGLNHFAPPYHAVFAKASELFTELAPANVQDIRRFDRQTDQYLIYSGSLPDFNIVRGESYLITVGSDYQYTPSHY